MRGASAVVSGNEEWIEKLEKAHPEYLFVDSEARGLSYVAAKGDNRILILGKRGAVILNRGQLYALCKEGMDVFNAFHGRGGIGRTKVRKEKQE